MEEAIEQRKKQTIIDKIKKFFEKYFGIDNSNNENEEFKYNIAEDDSEGYLDMVAEEDENYNYKSDKEENV